MWGRDDYLWDLLSKTGVLSSVEVKSLQSQWQQEELSVIEFLTRNQLVALDLIYKILAQEFNLPLVLRLEDQPYDKELLALLSEEQVKNYRVFPIAKTGSLLRLAISNPMDLDTLDILPHLLKLKLEFVLVPLPEIDRMIALHYDIAEEKNSSQPVTATDSSSISYITEKSTPDDAPVIQLVYRLIQDAYQLRASDIHLEPLAQRFRLRYRVDGVLLEMPDLPKSLQPTVFNRLKIMANLNIAEKRLPQDGRISIIMTDNHLLDLRVATIPTIHGESMAMRLLDQSREQLSLSQLGLVDKDLTFVEEILGSSNGLFLVTGPTGSGKTTTLYSCLNKLNTIDRKILTVEDPVEYELAGIQQLQVQDNIGLTFARSLRAFLRQDPDCILIGEIRDQETARIAIQSAMTGHLVLTSLHTNNAAGAITRLIDMGIEPFLITSTLKGILAQRLVRRICPDCKTASHPPEYLLSQLGLNSTDLANLKFYQGQGCVNCQQTGYQGRFGIFELLNINESIQQLIHRKSSTQTLQQKAVELGMQTLRQEGIRAILAGATTLAEILKQT